MTTTTTMDEYRAAVAEASRLRNGEPIIANRSHAHAAIILEHLFGSARNSVEIISNHLEREVYEAPEVIGAAVSFLENYPAGTIEILTEQPVNPAHPFLHALVPFGERVSVSEVPEKFQGTYSYNFCVVDQDCYRFEANRKECDATIQFGNRATATNIHATFQVIKGLSAAGHSRQAR